MNAQKISATGRPVDTFDPRSEPAPMVLQVIAVLLVLGVLGYVGFLVAITNAFQGWHTGI